MSWARRGHGVGSLKSCKTKKEVLRRATHRTAVGGDRGQIDQLLAGGVGEIPRESLSELAKLGARLIIQRAVEDEFDAWLGRARYERRPDYRRRAAQLRERVAQRLWPPQGADGRGAVRDRNPAGARGGGDVCLQPVAKDTLRARADQGDRALLAGLRPPTLLRAPRTQPLRQAARVRAR